MRSGHDSECESELTSHGYTPCCCDLRILEDWRVCGCGRPYDRNETVTDECASCYDLRFEMLESANVSAPARRDE
jgi:hypothetical protein